MRVVPVIDLLDGQVVQAIAGQRDQYEPFENTRFQFDSALDLCAQWIDEFQPEWIYVADLNAIQGQGNNLDVLRSLVKLNTCIVLDSGISTVEDFRQLKSVLTGQTDANTWLPVVGSESIESWSEFTSLQNEIKSEFIFSIDLKHQKILGPAFNDVSLPELVKIISESTISDVVLLDLDSVGTHSNHFQKLADFVVPGQLPFRVFIGGGVKNQSDLELLNQLGFAGAFVSTALHQGTIR